jgi:tetratricopeptide (TPR) repeat protein
LVQDLDLAVADFTEAIRLDPGYAQAYANRGFAHGRMATRYGNMDYRQKAAADFRKAQQLGMDVR